MRGKSWTFGAVLGAAIGVAVALAATLGDHRGALAIKAALAPAETASIELQSDAARVTLRLSF